MDPGTITTTVASAALDPGAVVGIVVALLALFGAPWWVGPAVRIGVAVFLGARAAGMKVEEAPAPVSDGGTAAERELPPAQQTSGEAGGGPTGGNG
jgi:hypothetical protein